MLTGTVRFYNERKGFGFLCADGTDYFIGRGEIERAGLAHLTIDKGMKLAFVAAQDRRGRGPIATQLALASGTDETSEAPAESHRK
jgi:cold shock CspA family protein